MLRGETKVVQNVPVKRVLLEYDREEKAVVRRGIFIEAFAICLFYKCVQGICNTSQRKGMSSVA